MPSLWGEEWILFHIYFFANKVNTHFQKCLGPAKIWNFIFNLILAYLHIGNKITQKGTTTVNMNSFMFHIHSQTENTVIIYWICILMNQWSKARFGLFYLSQVVSTQIFLVLHHFRFLTWVLGIVSMHCQSVPSSCDIYNHSWYAKNPGPFYDLTVSHRL